MKILIAADIFPPQTGGPATYSVLLANALAQKGHDLCIVSLNPASDLQAASCPIYPTSSKGKIGRYISYVKLLWKQAKNADVLYAMGPVSAGLPALIVAKFQKKKLVVKVVGDYAWEQGMQRAVVTEDIDVFQQDEGGGLLVSSLRFIERLVVKHADAIITPSHYLQRMVIGWGAKPNNVMVVYNAVDVPEIVPVQKPQHEQWIVSVARLVPWKGMDAVMNAFIQVAQPHQKLIIIGDGPEYSRLAQRAQHTDALICTGALPREQAYAYVQAADALILNSGYEGLSHVLIEAMKLGTYILASDKGGNPELLEGKAIGEIFTYNDEAAIAQQVEYVLMHKPEPRISEQALRPFSQKEMVANTEAILSSLCMS